MHPGTTPDLDSVINNTRTSRFQGAIIALCAAVMLLDGFDTQSISFAAPAIIARWHVPAAGFGLVFGIGLFGGLIGAVGTGVIADRIGRKPTLLISVVLFGVFSLATPLVHSMAMLDLIRLLTGIGVGGAVPTAIAIAAEYAPARARAAVTAMTFCGIPLGSVLGSVLASRLIPAYGWGSVFLAGGALPLLLLPFLAAFVPESIRFLSLKRNTAAITRLLTRMGVPEHQATQVEIGPDTGPPRAPVRSLFTEGRAPGTGLLSLALSLALFLTLLMAFFCVNWIPTLATRAGIGASAAILAVAAFNIGGVLGSLVISKLSGRRGPGMVISVSYALGAVAIGCIGLVGTSGTWLLITTFIAGLLAIGAQMCTVSLLALYYDTRLRATGIGWAIGCGRVGGIVGPVIGGWLIAASVSMSAIFVIAGLGSAACALTVFALHRLILRVPAGRTRMRLDATDASAPTG